MMATLRSRATVSMTLFTPVPRGAKSLARPWEAKAPQPKGKFPVLTWAAR